MDRFKRLSNALKNYEASLFTCFTLKKSYIHHGLLPLVPDYFFERSIHMLASAKNSDELRSTAEKCHDDLINNNPHAAKFATRYLQYKHKDKIEEEMRLIDSLLKGNTILNYGSGLGHLSKLLAVQSRHVVDFDVVDYKNGEVNPHADNIDNHLKHNNSEVIEIDTTLVKSTLHHIDKIKQIPVLKKIASITKSRLVVIEEFCDLSDKYVMPFLFELHESPTFANFSTLSFQSRIDVLMIIDYIGNHLIGGQFMMNMPFSFRSINEWVDIIQEQSMYLTDIHFLCFPNFMLHTSNHAIMVFDKE